MRPSAAQFVVKNSFLELLGAVRLFEATLRLVEERPRWRRGGSKSESELPDLRAGRRQVEAFLPRR